MSETQIEEWVPYLPDGGDTGLEASVALNGGVAIVTLRGDLDSYSHPALRHLLRTRVPRGVPVVLDLRDTLSIDSPALAEIAHLAGRLAREGRRLGASGRDFARLARALRLNRLLELADDPTELAATLRRRESLRAVRRRAA